MSTGVAIMLGYWSLTSLVTYIDIVKTEKPSRRELPFVAFVAVAWGWVFAPMLAINWLMRTRD